MNVTLLARLHAATIAMPELFRPCGEWRSDRPDGFPATFGIPGLLAELEGMTWATPHYGMFLTIDGATVGVDHWAADTLGIGKMDADRLFRNRNPHDVHSFLAELAGADV